MNHLIQTASAVPTQDPYFLALGLLSLPIQQEKAKPAQSRTEWNGYRVGICDVNNQCALLAILLCSLCTVSLSTLFLACLRPYLRMLSSDGVG